MGRTIGIVMTLTNKFSAEIKKIAKETGVAEHRVKRAAEGVKQLKSQLGEGAKAAATAFVGGITLVTTSCSIAVKKTAEMGDRIDKMSQKIGLSRQKFQQWDYILSQSGADIEKMQVGMKTLSQQMVNSTKKGSEAQKIFKRLGVSVRDSRGHFIKQEEAFERVIMAFQKMPDGIEKANMAQKLFGKTGSDLRPLLNGVRGNVEELKKKYVELGLGMSDEAVDASVKFTDAMDTLNRVAQATGAQLGSALIPTLLELNDKILTNVPQIQAAVTRTGNSIKNVLQFCIKHFGLLRETTVGLFTAFLAYKAAAGVITFIKTLRTTIILCKNAQVLWNLAIAACPISWLAVGIAGVIAGVVLLWRNWDKVTAALKKAAEWFKRVRDSFFKNETSTITIKTKEEHEKEKDKDPASKDEKPSSEPKKPKKHALGTSYFTGKSAEINEMGRGEIVDLPNGTRIIPHDVAVKSQSKPSQAIVLNVNVENVIGEEEFVYKLAEILAGKLKFALAVV